MKFMNSFQCLMGGNGVQFQASASGSSLVLPPADTSCKVVKKKKKSKKKKKMKEGKVIKVFKPDGEINVYHKPISASEVMTEELMVCRSDSFYIGQKIPPLSQHDRLQPGHTYFLLPTHLFHSVLSFVTIASFASSSSSSHDKQIQDDSNMKMKAAFLKKAASSSCPPFDIHKTPSGTLRIRVSELFISQLMLEQAATDVPRQLLCTTPELHKEYKQLVVRGWKWKPKLDMIKEVPPKGKRKVKMLLSASISRVKRKINSNNKVSQPHQVKKKKNKAKNPAVSASLKPSKTSG